MQLPFHADPACDRGRVNAPKRLPAWGSTALCKGAPEVLPVPASWVVLPRASFSSWRPEVFQKQGFQAFIPMKWSIELGFKLTRMTNGCTFKSMLLTCFTRISALAWVEGTLEQRHCTTWQRDCREAIARSTQRCKAVNLAMLHTAAQDPKLRFFCSQARREATESVLRMLDLWDRAWTPWRTPSGSASKSERLPVHPSHEAALRDCGLGNRQRLER